MKYLTKEKLEETLKIKDLTENSGHCLQLLVLAIKESLENYYKTSALIEKGEPQVLISDNYDVLGYSRDEVTLSERYTRYISQDKILRTHMTSAIPPLLKKYSKKPQKNVLWLCPGLVYRRDVVDKTHVGEPHQMDVWYLTKGSTSRKDLLLLVEKIIEPLEKILQTKLKYRINETSHHYTDGGIEVEVLYKGRWLEILECGLAGKNLLNRCGVNPTEYSGLALGMGLDRLAMIIKGIDDIRILRSSNPKISALLYDLKPYKKVSNQPAIKRDLSISIQNKTSLEELTEKILSTLGPRSEAIEEISLLASTPYEQLPSVAIERLGTMPNQSNWLLRIVIRHLSKTLTSQEANEIYSLIYNEINEGKKGYLME